ncbi:unnamed protein product, partial [Pleuronectes platessa]
TDGVIALLEPDAHTNLHAIDPERVFDPGSRPHMRQVVALLWSWHGIRRQGWQGYPLSPKT